MEQKKKGKGKTVVKVLGSILATLLVLCIAYTAIMGDNLLPTPLPYGLYPVSEQQAEGILKPGALVWTHRNQPVVQGDYITRLEEGNTRIFEQAETDGTGEVVLYQVAFWGTVVLFLHQNMIAILCGLVGLLILCVLIPILTAPRRRMKKRRQELLDLFAFYGEKYDLEDADIDY